MESSQSLQTNPNLIFNNHPSANPALKIAKITTVVLGVIALIAGLAIIGHFIPSLAGYAFFNLPAHSVILSMSIILLMVGIKILHARANRQNSNSVDITSNQQISGANEGTRVAPAEDITTVVPSEEVEKPQNQSQQTPIEEIKDLKNDSLEHPNQEIIENNPSEDAKESEIIENNPSEDSIVEESSDELSELDEVFKEEPVVEEVSEQDIQFNNKKKKKNPKPTLEDLKKSDVRTLVCFLQKKKLSGITISFQEDAQFNAQYQNRLEVFLEDLKLLNETTLISDLLMIREFHFPDGAVLEADGVTVEKLCRESEFFNALIYGNFKEKDSYKIVINDDVNFTHLFNDFKNFPSECSENILYNLDLANKWGFKTLKQKYEELLITSIPSIEAMDLISFYDAAVSAECKKLQSYCKKSFEKLFINLLINDKPVAIQLARELKKRKIPLALDLNSDLLILTKDVIDILNKVEIEKLNLSKCKKLPDNILIKILKKQKSLKKLDIGYTNLLCEHIKILSKTSQLEELFLTGLQIVDKELNQILKQQKSLKSLRLTNCKFLQFKDVSAFSEISQLKVLYLSGTQIKDEELNQILKQQKSLKILSLARCKFLQFKDVSGFSEISPLKTLNLSYNQIKDKELNQVLKHQKFIEILHISHCTFLRFEEVDGFAELSNLKQMSFTDCNVTTKRIQEILPNKRLISTKDGSALVP